MGRKRLSGQRALVTGASSGIGLELARVLAEEGAHLVLVARRADRLEALAAELKQKHGVDARVVPVDLQQPDAAKELFDKTEGAGLAIDVLVNNAGFGNYDDFTAIPWEKHATMLQVNVIALTQLSWLFLPKMVERRHGYLMNVASIGAYLPCPTFAVYAASKAYVRNVTEAIAYELKRTGVRAISVCPGGTTTEFLDAANQQLKPGASLAMMSAERCARIAVKKMLGGRRNVVTGFLNSLGMWALRFVPRGMYAWLGAVSMGAAVDKKPPALPGPGAPAAALPGPPPVA
jgi:short-subunit dehydrogenase